MQFQAVFFGVTDTDLRTLGIKVGVSSLVALASIRITPADLVWCCEDDSRIGHTYISKRFRSAFAKVDLACRSISPKSLRLSLNTHLLAAGANPVLVAKYFGWSPAGLTPVQLKHYTHLEQEQLLSVAAAIDGIFGTVLPFPGRTTVLKRMPRRTNGND